MNNLWLTSAVHIWEWSTVISVTVFKIQLSTFSQLFHVPQCMYVHTYYEVEKICLKKKELIKSGNQVTAGVISYSWHPWQCSLLSASDVIQSSTASHQQSLQSSDWMIMGLIPPLRRNVRSLLGVYLPKKKQSLWKRIIHRVCARWCHWPVSYGLSWCDESTYPETLREI